MAIRVLIAEDSQTSRDLIVAILRADPTIEIVGQARDGAQAVEMAKQLRPDVIAMDIQMPKLDGFEAAQQIMASTPTPILLFSNELDPNNTQIAIRALNAGALAILPKSTSPSSVLFDKASETLLWTLKAIAGVRVLRTSSPQELRRRSKRNSTSKTQTRNQRKQIIAIGASTGGPQALHLILSALPDDFSTPLLIVQHIGEGFSAGFAKWLSGLCQLRIKVAEEGEFIAPRTVYVAPDNLHLGISRNLSIQLSEGPPISGFRPSVTHLFQSVAEHCGSAVTAVMLSGMGEDGVQGLRAIKKAGGLVLAQDEATSVVFGMSGRAVQEGLADYVLSPTDIARILIEDHYEYVGSRKASQKL